MKQDTLTRAGLVALLAKVAPSISVETIWEHDTDLHPDIRKDCDGFENENPEDWQAWRSEVCASAVVNGTMISGSDYLGGTWEKAVDHPSKSNPDISGYFPDMLTEAVKELGKQVPTGHPLQREINAALVALA